MRSDKTTPPPNQHTEAGQTQTPIGQDQTGDEALNALGTLEKILDSHKDLVRDGAVADSGAYHDGRYSIPLLDEVLQPGRSAGGASAEQALLELSPEARRLFDRLASEIDVIVQSGVEEALKAAAKNIRARVKQHVAIVLPEILDELTHEYHSEPDQEPPVRD